MLSHVLTVFGPGVIDIVTSVHEGMSNVPRLYGSEVRQPGKVTDFVSGIKEAGKVPFMFVIMVKSDGRQRACSTGIMMELRVWFASQ
jgi:hypothetical protein